jgi:hypothetical protein
LDAFPGGIEAAFEGSFYLSNRGANGVLDGVKELGGLVNAEERVGVKDERDNDLAGSERAAFEESVARVRVYKPSVSTPDAGTGVPGLNNSFATLWTRSLFSGLITAPLNLRVERSGRNTNEVSSTRYCRILPKDV